MLQFDSGAELTVTEVLTDSTSPSLRCSIKARLTPSTFGGAGYGREWCRSRVVTS